MSKDSWERAFGAMDGQNSPLGYSGEDRALLEMRRKQREIQQEGWNKDLEEIANQPSAIRNVNEQDPSPVSWAEAYKDTTNNNEEPAAELELTVEEQILRELERTGHFRKAQGLLGSIKMLINEFNITKHQLATIKRAIGQ